MSNDGQSFIHLETKQKQKLDLSIFGACKTADPYPDTAQEAIFGKLIKEQDYELCPDCVKLYKAGKSE